MGDATNEWEGAIAAEGRAREAFDIALEKFLPYAATQWHYGDGKGAIVLDALRAAFPEPATQRGYVKRGISNALRTRVYERDAYRCNTCGTWKNLSVDHIVPESKGGPTDLDNLQTLCRPCNAAKGTKV